VLDEVLAVGVHAFGGNGDSMAAGKVKISGAMRLPHELLAKVLPSALGACIAKRLVQVVDAQWGTMIARLRDAGMLVNSLASCVASGPMNYINWLCPGETQPTLLVVALSMMLTQLTKQPFTNVFTTFSVDPKIVVLQEGTGLVVNAMVTACTQA
jgi:hypothetical protein